MALTKKLQTFHITGATVYAIIRREVDGYLLNDADGAFASAPADPYLSLAEDATIKGLYEVAEARTVWNTGEYRVFLYHQVGGSPSPVADTIIAMQPWRVVADAFHDAAAIVAAFAAAQLVLDKLTFDPSNVLISTQLYPTGAVVTDALNSTMRFKTDLAYAADDTLENMWVRFTSGDLLDQVQKVATYTASTKVITTMGGFTDIPAVGVTFELINR